MEWNIYIWMSDYNVPYTITHRNNYTYNSFPWVWLAEHCSKVLLKANRTICPTIKY